MRPYGFAAILACLACALLPAAASAQTGSRQSAELRFVDGAPGVSTGVTLSIDYVNPSDPKAKPPAVRRVVQDLAEGAQIDTSIPARCTAADALLMVQGAQACPADSRVGAGVITIDTGFPEPGRFIVADVVFFNNTNQLIFVSTERGSGARLVTRSTIEGPRFTTDAPPLPGAPPDGGAIDVVQVHLDEVSRDVGGVQRGYITTPGSCPDSRAWINSVAFTYADGLSQTVNTASSCVKGGAQRGRCANERNGSPSRDRLAGTGAGDRIFGLRGRDRLSGRRGRDCLHGHRGHDLLLGGPGRDRLFGGSGNDTCRGGPGRDRLRGCERGH